mgnify:CR=1 FL=1
MELKLHFLGAARNVTGSSYLIETPKARVMIDCGMYQERKFKERNWQDFPVKPASVDAVVLTHAHLDHCGLLPKFVRDGFNGKIWGTAPTMEIAEIVVLDSAHIQEEDCKYKKKRHEEEERQSPFPYVPLYTSDDARFAIDHFKKTSYEKSIEVAPGVVATWHDAGHILGASMVTVEVEHGGEKRKLLFSGDVGRCNKPIICDPTFFDHADYVVCESTYGDRVHKRVNNLHEDLQEIIVDTTKRGGNIVIPSFAIERTHELLYLLNDLLMAKKIPNLMVFVDSPMAVNVTDVFIKHPEYFDDEMKQRLRSGNSPFTFSSLKLSRSVADSKAINNIKGTCIIIAGSGMCTGGRIKHHLVHNIWRSESTILFVGYQAEGTLGRVIVQGKKSVRIHGRSHQVKARIDQLQGFSGHADKAELFKWVSNLKEPPKKVFVTHGEESAALEFADFITKKLEWDVHVPTFKEVVDLE